MIGKTHTSRTWVGWMDGGGSITDNKAFLVKRSPLLQAWRNYLISDKTLYLIIFSVLKESFWQRAFQKTLQLRLHFLLIPHYLFFFSCDVSQQTLHHSAPGLTPLTLFFTTHCGLCLATPKGEISSPCIQWEPETEWPACLTCNAIIIWDWSRNNLQYDSCSLAWAT